MTIQIAGTLYIITAPSGTGKTTLANGLVASMEKLRRSVSYTTRPQRAGEVQGVDYWFVSQAEFDEMVATNAFLEFAQVFNYFYGTSKSQVEQYLQAGEDVILAIDWQGAAQVREHFLAAISIFVLPPSREQLQQRLQNRRQDQQEVIETRLRAAGGEVAHYGEFDYLVINEVLADALADLCAIVRANRISKSRQAIKYAGLLEEWLKMH